MLTYAHGCGDFDNLLQQQFLTREFLGSYGGGLFKRRR
jgi:hypothetical protein